MAPVPFFFSHFNLNLIAEEQLQNYSALVSTLQLQSNLKLITVNGLVLRRSQTALLVFCQNTLCHVNKWQPCIPGLCDVPLGASAPTRDHKRLQALPSF